MVPILAVVLANTYVTATALRIAYKSGGRANVTNNQRLLRTMYNTLLLTGLLGLTWLCGTLIPAGIAFEYIFVILNAGSGVYILAYSVLANPPVRNGFRKRLLTLRRRKSAMDGDDGGRGQTATTGYTYNISSSGAAHIASVDHSTTF